MRILVIVFLALIGIVLDTGTAIAASGSNTASAAQNSATPQLQFFPPTAYGSPCSKSAPVVAWNGAGSGKGTYCITLPICATGQLLTTVADGDGNPSFICVDPASSSSLASTTSGLDATTSSSGTSTTATAATSGSDECSYGPGVWNGGGAVCANQGGGTYQTLSPAPPGTDETIVSNMGGTVGNTGTPGGYGSCTWQCVGSATTGYTWI